MINAKFTIKNYRCFSDEKPLEFVLHNGFTAFIGPNNSGKSFILKFFYEFRNIWQTFSDPNNLANSLSSQVLSPNFNGVTDQAEVFYRYHERNIQIGIEINRIRLLFEVSRSNQQIKNTKLIINGQPINANSIQIRDSYFRHDKLGDGTSQTDASEILELFGKLSRSIYIPSFRNAINIGGKDNYFDINVGEAFINMWENWQTGSQSSQNQKITDLIRDIGELFGYNNLQITAARTLKTLQIVINGRTQRLYEIGSGISQFILVFASAAFQNPSFILIDEPELNLHPSLQQKFLTSLASYAQDGVLFATHSIGLARSVGDYIYSVVKPENSSEVKQFEDTPTYAEFLGELSFSTYQELGMNKILLVEGPTEIKTIQQFLRKMKKDQNCVLLSLGGASMINEKREQELSEIKRITGDTPDSIYCWIDSEKDSNGTKLSTERQQFLDMCGRLSIKAKASDKRAMENYFTESAIQKIKGDKVNALDDYEKLDGRWGKEENWRIAKEMELGDIKDTDLGEFLLLI